MTSTRSLKLSANAGDPDAVLALRIDVVAAAVAWYEAMAQSDVDVLDQTEMRLERAVRRYRRALAKRRGAA